MVEATNAIFGLLVVVIPDKAKPEHVSNSDGGGVADDLPFAKASGVVDDGLRAFDVTKALAPTFKHLIRRLWKQASNVYIGLSSDVLQSSVEWLEW